MIDWTRVNELRDEIGPADFAELVEIFLLDVTQDIAALQADTARDGLEMRLHSLKGSALNLGFSGFCELCRAGERAAATGNAAAVDLPGIVSAFQADRAEFLAGLDRRS